MPSISWCPRKNSTACRVPVNGADDVWKEYTKDPTLPVDRNRFALISKSHKSYNSRLHSIKLIVLNELSREFLDSAQRIVKTAFEESIIKLMDFDIYDLEHIIFRSSYSEGAWEFDTLLHILNIFQRAKLVELSKTSEELITHSAFLRKAISLPITKPKLTEPIQKLRQLELYDEDINKFNFPLETGDIFTIPKLGSDGNQSGNRSYILLTQPCDLMVREESPPGPGERNGQFGFLALLSNLSTTDTLLSYEIEHFSSTPTFVDFRHMLMIDLSILDLCVFNSEGISQLSLTNSPLPNGLLKAWQIRYESLFSKFRNSFEIYDRMNSLITTNSSYDQDLDRKIHERLTGIFPSLPSKLSLSPEINTDNIKYPVTRIKRLRQPWAGAVVTRYSYALSRSAFDHDFTVIRQNKGAEQLK